jgi:hypothetical protein
MSDVNVNIKAGQQVGLAQQSAISLSDQKKVAGSREESSGSEGAMDSVDLSRASQGAGLQTGLLQNLAMQKVKGAKGDPPQEEKTPKEETPAKPPQAQVPPSTGAPPQAPPQQGTKPPGTDNSSDPAAGTIPPEGSATEAANRAKAHRDDVNNAMTIWWQMKADQSKWWANVMKIMQDTQTEIFKIWQEAYANRVSVQNKVYEMWGKLARGE